MLCAERSPKKYMTSALKNCVTYGLRRCTRPYALNGVAMGSSHNHAGPGIVFADGVSEACAEGDGLEDTVDFGLEN